jgi:hypothetical protein
MHPLYLIANDYNISVVPISEGSDEDIREFYWHYGGKIDGYYYDMKDDFYRMWEYFKIMYQNATVNSSVADVMEGYDWGSSALDYEVY